MPWESDEEQGAAPGRDWAKYMWVVIGVLIAVGAAAMFMPQPDLSDSTRAQVAHILIKIDTKDEAGVKAALEEAKTVREQLQAGANFAKLAAEHSDDPLTAAAGGDLGWVHRSEMVEPVDEYIWNAPLNEVSEPILTENGLHLIIVRERKISKSELHEMELKNRVLHQQPGEGTPAQ